MERVLLSVLLLFSVSTLAFLFVAALLSEASRTEVVLRVELLTPELLPRSIDELLLRATLVGEPVALLREELYSPL